MGLVFRILSLIMSIFCLKKLDPSQRLGNKLREKREAAGLTVEDIAAQRRIQKKYLEALESNNFRLLPNARAYRLAYVREYAEALGLEPKACVAQFVREEGLGDTAPVHPHRTIKLFPFASISMFARNALLICVVLLFGGYLATQIRGILRPPKLAVFTPQDGYVVTDLATVVQGETEPEARLTINGQNVVVDEAGRFETKVDLTAGVNTITVLAAKKHGKTTTVVRNLVVKARSQTEPISLK